LSDQRRIELYSIFNWFKEDIDKAGGVQKIPVKYGPQQYHDFLAAGTYEISYLT